MSALDSEGNSLLQKSVSLFMNCFLLHLTGWFPAPQLLNKSQVPGVEKPRTTTETFRSHSLSCCFTPLTSSSLWETPTFSELLFSKLGITSAARLNISLLEMTQISEKNVHYYITLLSHIMELPSMYPILTQFTWIQFSMLQLNA